MSHGYSNFKLTNSSTSPDLIAFEEGGEGFFKMPSKTRSLGNIRIEADNSPKENQSFDSGVLESDVPVLVDFWAVWCGPCKAIAPIIEEIANDYDGKVKVGKVDVDNNNQVAMKYGIRSIPTLLLFKGGEVVDQVIGNVGKESIESMLNKAL